MRGNIAAKQGAQHRWRDAKQTFAVFARDLVLFDAGVDELLCDSRASTQQVSAICHDQRLDLSTRRLDLIGRLGAGAEEETTPE